MAHILRKPKPKLSDISPTKSNFNPGDRVIARVGSKLDINQTRKIRRAVEKFAGCSVEVMIVDVTKGWIQINRSCDGLIKPEVVYTTPNVYRNPTMGVIGLSCTKLRFMEGDTVLVEVFTQLTESQVKSIQHDVIKFAGCEVVVIVTSNIQGGIDARRSAGKFIQTDH